jgi:TonB family protein
MMLDTTDRPIPAASAAPAASACSVPDSDPKIKELQPPRYSAAMRERNKAGIVDVTIALRADGSIEKAEITRRSGDDLLDDATLTAALATTYLPQVKNCTFVAGSYIFRARFRSAPQTAGAPLPDGPAAFPTAAPEANRTNP